MNWKKIITATFIVYIVHEILNFVIHAVILGPTYQAMTGVWRENMESLMWVMYLAEVVFIYFFVFIFARGYEGRGVMEGVRYGLIIASLTMIPGMFAQYVTFDISLNLTLIWIAFGYIQLVIDGIVASLIYKPAEAAK